VNSPQRVRLAFRRLLLTDATLDEEAMIAGRGCKTQHAYVVAAAWRGHWEEDKVPFLLVNAGPCLD